MKIRARLTLWYAAIFSASLLVIGLGIYSELVVEQRAKIARHHRASAVDADAGSDIVFIIGLYGGSALMFGLLGGWWITRKALAPVTTLTEAVEKIHDGNLRGQLPRSGNGDELDRLTEVFNAMTGRLDGSFQRIREFTLHASHELKTPLTVMRGELESDLNDAALTSAQKERLLSQMDEIERLAKIVDGLTLLTKADAGQIQLTREPLQLDELVREALADAKILAQPQGIQVALETCEPVLINGDRHRLRQLLLNLTDNAVKYNQPGGGATLSLQVKESFAELKITNTGAGISPDLQPRVFERFFRGDTAQAGDLDGCGLGLSIAHWIVTAHGGEIIFHSEPGRLTTVAVRLRVNNLPVS